MVRSASARIATTRPSRLDRPHSESAPAPPLKRRMTGVIPWGLLGMVGLILAVEGLVARHWLVLSDPVSLSWQFADRAARDEARECGVLCLGDSLVKHGLVPAILDRESGLRSVNLAAARAPALFTYFVLRRALDAGARPSAIVIDTKPAVLIGGADYNAHYWPAALSPLECLELGRISGRGRLGLAVLVARLLPSLQSRLEIRSGMQAQMNGADDPIHEINRVLWRNWSVNAGANVAIRESSYRGELAPDILDKLHPDRWYVERSNAEGIDRLIRLARGRGVRVYWLLPPISPGLQGCRERSGSEAKYEGFVRSFQGRYPKVVTVLDGRRIARDPTLYVDATHLSGRGAVVLSRAVGRVLKAGAAHPGGEWITLEDPADDPRGESGHMLEDIDQSKRVVRGPR
jgi:hypothetical protein